MRQIAKLSRIIGVAGAIIGAASSLPQAVQAQEVDFTGETIEIMVNFAAGGGTDTAARLVAPFVAKHLPGKPNLIVTNKAGAGGTAAIAYLMDSVAPDGLHIGYFAGTPLRWALGMDQVPQGTGDLPFVGARSVNQIFMVRTDANLDFDAFPDNKNPIFFAVNSPDNHVAIRAKLLANAIGADNFKIITGYKTQGKMVAAARAKETEMAQTNDSFFGANREALVGDGVLKPLGQMGEYNNGKIGAQNGLEDIPVFDELWRSASPETVDSPAYNAWEGLHIAMSIQNSFVLPPDTPEKFYKVWGDAIAAAYQDPDYIKQLNAAGVPIPTAVGYEETKARMKSLEEIFSDPETRTAIEAAIDQNME